ncbi:MAG: DUF3445 domain-containing protein, partial [Devosia sp.]
IESAHANEVWAAEPETIDAQSEVLALLVEHLPRHFPEIYRSDGAAMRVAGQAVPLDGDAPLKVASRLVQEDLVLMRRGEIGWRLAAASLCFPSGWNLTEKFGRPIHEIHAPVPAFGPHTRNAELIARMFDNLKPETGMLRWNWSIHPAGTLFRPAIPGMLVFGPQTFLRVERQTLRRLPQSGDILFTIRIYAEPIEAIARQANAREIAAGLVGHLQALDASQLDYKGMTGARDEVVRRLEAL